MQLAEAQTLAAAASVYLANPHGDVRAWETAQNQVALQHGQADAALTLLAQADQAAARRVALAFGLYESLFRRATPQLFDRARVKDRVLGGLSLDRAELRALTQAAARCEHQLAELAGVSQAARKLRAAVWSGCFGASLYDALGFARVVIREQNVLILGETGTGKELVASAIAEGALGPDDDVPAPAQALNAAAVPRELLESELFGHVAGAFSGAQRDRVGKLAAAHGGTLFLDELGDLAPELQPKLLRVMETRKVAPIGANHEQPADVRYLAATSRDLGELLDQPHGFRRDLYERLAGVVIRLPPLRERPEDLGVIAERIFARMSQRLSESAQRSGTPPVGELDSAGGYRSAIRRLGEIQERLVEWLQQPELRTYHWPGNVRELASAIRTRIMGFGDGDSMSMRSATARPLDTGLLPPELAEMQRFFACEATLEEIQDWYLERVTASTNHNLARAAKILDIDRGTLARHLKRLKDD